MWLQICNRNLKIIMSLLKHNIQLDKLACCALIIMFLKWCESAFLGGTLSYMKNLLINRPIVSLIEPSLNIFFKLFLSCNQRLV